MNNFCRDCKNLGKPSSIYDQWPWCPISKKHQFDGSCNMKCFEPKNEVEK